MLRNLFLINISTSQNKIKNNDFLIILIITIYLCVYPKGSELKFYDYNQININLFQISKIIVSKELREN